MTDVNRGFKHKTIVKIIDQKIKDWLDNMGIDDQFREQITNSYILTGGAITSMLLGEQPNDFDIYFSDSATAERVAKFYVDKINGNQAPNERIGQPVVENLGTRIRVMIKSAGVLSSEADPSNYEYFESRPPEEATQYFEQKNRSSEKYHPVLITSNAITLNDGIQLIIRFVGSASEIHKNFDFIHATSYYTKAEGLVLKQSALESILSRSLIYSGSLYPICAMIRVRKFLERGWTISAGQIMKICYDISKLNLDDTRVLEEQLIGVDQAYFHQVLSMLRSHHGDVDRTYLFEALNRAFDTE